MPFEPRRKPGQADQEDEPDCEPERIQAREPPGLRVENGRRGFHAASIQPQKALARQSDFARGEPPAGREDKRSQLEFQVNRARDWVGAIGSDLLESQLAVNLHGGLHHWLDGIKTHPLVSGKGSFGDDRFRESAAEPFASKFWTEVKALHFADILVEPVQRDATCEPAIILRQQQAAVGWRVVAGQRRQFLVKTLEAQVEVEGLRVL